MLTLLSSYATMADILPHRVRQVVDATEDAVNQAQNGDPSALIWLIIGGIAFGIVWLWVNKDKLG